MLSIKMLVYVYACTNLSFYAITKIIYKQQQCVHISYFMQNFGVALIYLSFKAYTTGCLQR